MVSVFGGIFFLNKKNLQTSNCCEKPFRVTSNADRPLSKGREVTTLGDFFQKRLPTKKIWWNTNIGDSLVILKEVSIRGFPEMVVPNNHGFSY